MPITSIQETVNVNAAHDHQVRTSQQCQKRPEIFREPGREGRGYATGVKVTGNCRCYNCDASNFTLERFVNCEGHNL